MDRRARDGRGRQRFVRVWDGFPGPSPAYGRVMARVLRGKGCRWSPGVGDMDLDRLVEVRHDAGHQQIAGDAELDHAGEGGRIGAADADVAVD